jgi:hypothetical protein
MVWLFYRLFLSIWFCLSILPVEAVVLMLLTGFLVPSCFILSSLTIISFRFRLMLVVMGLVNIWLSAVSVFGLLADSLDPVFQ